MLRINWAALFRVRRTKTQTQPSFPIFIRTQSKRRLKPEKTKQLYLVVPPKPQVGEISAGARFEIVQVFFFLHFRIRRWREEGSYSLWKLCGNCVLKGVLNFRKVAPIIFVENPFRKQKKNKNKVKAQNFTEIFFVWIDLQHDLESDLLKSCFVLLLSGLKGIEAVVSTTVKKGHAKAKRREKEAKNAK